ncbi:MAG TPA: hypothetical protein VIG48_06350 [Jatrophihabitans sp.]
MPDLEDELRADGAAWREQVDRSRPELSPRPARNRTWIGGLVAAALVLGLAVVVLALRHTDSPGGHVAAGDAPALKGSDRPVPVRTLPYLRRVPQQATCPSSGNRAYGSGMSFSLTRRTKAAPTIAAAAEAFPPKYVHWTIAARNSTSALLLYRAHYLHVVRLPGGGWAVDSGGSCGGADATVAR